MIEQTSYLSPDEVAGLGLASYGEDVRISRKASIYCPERVHLGSHVRVDDFVVMTSGPGASVRLGDHVHIAAHAALFGGGGITIEDYVTVSGRSSVYSVTDDYGGEVMTNPTVPEHFTRAIRQPVILRRHVVVGAASVVLPGVEVGEGSAVGAMTLVNRSLDPWGIYIGIPAHRLRDRSRDLLVLEAALASGEGRS